MIFLQLCYKCVDQGSALCEETMAMFSESNIDVICSASFFILQGCHCQEYASVLGGILW